MIQDKSVTSEDTCQNASDEVPTAGPVDVPRARVVTVGSLLDGNGSYAPQAGSPIEPRMSRLRAAVELVLLLPIAVIGSVAGAMGAGLFDPADERWLYVGMSLGTGILVALTCLVMLQIDRQPLRTIGWTSDRWPANIGIGLGALALAYALLATAALTAEKLKPGVLDGPSEAQQGIDRMFPQMPLWSLILLLVVVVLWEEIVLRGFLLTRLHVLVKRWWLAIPAGAVLFGAIHIYEGILAVFVIMGLSLIMGTLFAIRRSLVPSLALHFANNLVMFVFMTDVVKW